MTRLSALLLTALLAAACSGGDEAPSPTPQAESAEAEGPPTGAEWWSSARSLNEAPREVGDSDLKAMVSCRLGGSTRFTRRGDCLAQGGRPEAR